MLRSAVTGLSSLLCQSPILSRTCFPAAPKTASRCFSASSLRRSAQKMEKQVDIDGQRINYLQVGDGPQTILMLPGALGTGAGDFPPQVDAESGLASRGPFTVVAWDPPGYGKSRPAERTWPIDFFQRDAAVAAKLIKQLGGKAHLLGWSDGGITAMVMAVHHPDVVDKVAVWGSNAFISDKDMEMVSKVRDVSGWSAKMRKGMEDIYGVENFPRLWSAWVDAYQRIHSERKGEIVSDRLDEIAAPVLVVHGDKDAMVDPVHPEHMLKNIPNARLHSFPDGKHNLHLKYAKEFNELVAKFFLEK